MMEDSARLAAFERAIEETVRPGDVVLEIGAGTGILAMMAARRGARRVITFESGTMAELARAIVRENGFENVIDVRAGWSNEAELPESVDVLMGELLGASGLDEGIIGYFGDALRRMEGAPRLLPLGIDLLVAPVALGASYRKTVGFWRERPAGFSFERLAKEAAAQLHLSRIGTVELMGDAFRWAHVELGEQAATFVKGEAAWAPTESATLGGFAVWFDARLSARSSIANPPGAESSHWAQGFLPLATPIEVRAGDIIRVEISTNDGGLWAWRGETARGEAHVARFSQATLPSAPQRLIP